MLGIGVPRSSACAFRIAQRSEIALVTGFGVYPLEHDSTVVTRNVKDFANLGVKTFNPWEQGT